MAGIRLSGMISGLDTDSIVKQLVSAQKLRYKKTTDQSTLLTWKQEKWKDLNAQLYKLYTTDLSKLRLQGSYLSKAVTSSNDALVKVTGDATAPVGAHKIEVSKLASAQYVTGAKILPVTDGNAITNSTTLGELGFTNGTGNITINGADVPVTADTTINDFLEACKSAGLNANFDSAQNKLFISSKNSGVENRFTIKSSTTSDTGKSALEVLGLSGIDGTATTQPIDPNKMVVVAAADSEITLDGATLTGTSNTIVANGLTITATGLTTAGQSVSINVSNNSQANYDMVKNFIKSYNDILNEMNTLYYADSASGYAPLSDDEKASMSDTQIEKWESKIKDSILRRDDTIGSLTNAMKQALQTSVTYNGKQYSLATFGITTSSDYTEKGLLHIAGNTDDASFAATSDKLLKAFNEDPDATAAALAGIAQNLYKTMSDKMSSISNVRSAFTFYNDKEMATEQIGLKKTIAENETKINDLENKYYKQFSAMETAMAKIQSQTNALAGLLGNS